MALSLCLLGACLARADSQPGTVVAWGTCWNGTTYLPATANVAAGLTNVVAIAGGDGHSLALQSSRTVVAWGNNSHGQTNVPAGLSNVVAIAAGSDHSLALQSNGIVVAWGYNYYGQSTVPAGLTNAKAIAAGGGQSLAVRSDGTVTAWGYNNSGQANVPSGLTNVVSVAGGQYHSLALRSDGTVVAWGGNYNGQTNVPSGLTNVAAIAAGADYSLALRSNGTVAVWGDYFNGSVYTAMAVPAGLSNVVAIAGGADHALALQSNGTVVSWGMYFNGLIYVPMTTPAGLSNVVSIAGGYYHSLAISLGAGPTIVSPLPVGVLLTPGSATNLSVVVSSASPFGCQWSSNGVPIAGATRTSLLISNFAAASAGSYSVRVTNQGGYATAATLVRLVNSPIVLVDGVDVGGGTVSRVDSSVLVSMSSTFGSSADIYYTLDGSLPDFYNSALYSTPFTLTNSATLRAIAYNSAYSDWAETAPIYLQILPTYPLTKSTPGGGIISVSPAAYTNGNRYVSGTAITLTATPSNGWSFIRWIGDVASTNANPTTALMDQSRTVQAIFGTSLNLFTNGNGQILMDPAGGPYPYGSNVQLTARPGTNCYFFGWAGAATGFKNPLSIQATNASGITARFVPLNANQVSLTVLPSGNGTVAVSPLKNVYTNGETVTLTASPGAGNVFTGWSGDASDTANPLSLVLQSNKLVYAHFAPGTLNPPVITQPPGSRTLSDGKSTTLSFTFTGDNPLFYQWRFNGSPISGATNPTLSLGCFSASQAGLYSVVVSNPAGVATSLPASVALFDLEMASSATQTFPLLVLYGAVGTRYRLESCADLVPTNWVPLDTVTLEGNILYYLDGPITNQTRGFYRALPQ